MQHSMTKHDPVLPAQEPTSPPGTRSTQVAENILGVRVKGRLNGEEDDLFLYIDSTLRNLYELKVGDRIECVLLSIERAPRHERYSCQRRLEEGSYNFLPTDVPTPLPSGKSWWEIANYWNELHIPPDVARLFDLRIGDHIECEWLAIERS